MADTQVPPEHTEEQITTSTPQEGATEAGHGTNASDITQTQQEAHQSEEAPAEQGTSMTQESYTQPASDLSAAHQEEAKDGPPAPLPLSIDTSAPHPARTNSEAIGPDLTSPMMQDFPRDGPNIQFILLLASAGTRHPFQLNERYLAKRNVGAMGPDGKFDPSVISVYNLKELIFRDWRDDWETKPSSPSAIRLIYFGQLLADNTNLKECRIQTDGTANVLHISIKPQELMDDDDAAKGGCRCIVM